MKSIFIKVKDALYNKLVRKVPQICRQYEGYVNANKQQHQKHRLKSWCLLLKLNIAYHIFKLDLSNETVYSNKYPYCEGSESSLSYLGSPEEYAKQLLAFDVISFDIFDTLIFRPFARPDDLFHILAQKHEYLDFANLRTMAEYEARKQKKATEGTDEISITDIYEYIETYIGLSAKQGIEIEFETEKQLCFANPFMYSVFEILKQHHKKMILVSDMYLPKSMLQELLYSCGYDGFDEIFVSCEYQKSKHQGALYGVVKSRYGADKTYIHIGDNPHSDVAQAKNYGMNAIWYQNVNETGNPYRCDEMSRIVGSAYSGLVNAHLHNGAKQYSPQYEYGFVYGGLFVLGYCKFIHDYAQVYNLDKILFLARDGDILKRVYDKLYPDSKTEYVYWSRLAAKLSANHYKYDYIRRFIYHKVNSGITIKQALAAMELDSLLTEYQDDLNALLDSKNAKTVIAFVLEHWEEILAIYAPQVEAGKCYFEQVLAGCKNACAVDIGWAGSGANILSYMVNTVWGLDCNIVGIIAGTNAKSNAEPDASEALLQSGKLVSYLFSQSHNRNYWSTHNPSLGHNVIMELLLGSTKPSFQGFQLDDAGGYRLQFLKEESNNHPIIQEIQNGILDFVDYYTSRFQEFPYMFEISGSDAYAPISFATKNEGRYLKFVLQGCTFQVNVGDDNTLKDVKTIL